jgi:hypothetical protein
MNKENTNKGMKTKTGKIDIRVLLQRIVDRRNRRIAGTQGQG